MLAIEIRDYGDAAVLQPVEVPDPIAGDGEITIDVRYAAVGLIDVILRRGDIRFALPLRPGLSVSGEVRAIGAGAADFRLGDRVAAFTTPPRFGGYASVVAVPAALAASLSTASGEVSFDSGAALIVNGPAALTALGDLGGVSSGSAVVIHGATGALASTMAQVARHLGADPLIAVTGSADKHQAALALGYTHAFVTSDDLEREVRALTSGRGADVVVDPVGGPSRLTSLALLRPLGRLLAVGHASSEPDPFISPTDLWLGNQAILGLNVGALAATEPQRFQRAARRTMALAAAGAIGADIDRVYPLPEAADAHRRLESRLVTGTILLDCGQSDSDR